MANHKSALKRAKQNEVKRMRNKSIKTRLKTAIKAVGEQKPGEVSAEALSTAQSIIAKAAKKGVIHRRTAARQTSRLAKRANALAA